MVHIDFTCRKPATPLFLTSCTMSMGESLASSLLSDFIPSAKHLGKFVFLCDRSMGHAFASLDVTSQAATRLKYCFPSPKSQLDPTHCGAKGCRGLLMLSIALALR